MSTKTTFKRIALVTVAALGFGVLSSVTPASADNSSMTVGYTSLTLVGAGGTNKGFIPVRIVDGAGLNSAIGNTESLTATVIGWPTGIDSTTAATDLVLSVETRTAINTFAAATNARVSTSAGYADIQQLSNGAGASATSAANPADLGTYWFGVKAASGEAVDKGTYTIRFRLTDSTGFISSATIPVTLVSSAADSGAVITIATVGTFTSGESTTMTATKSVKATLTNGVAGGRIQLASSTTAIGVPVLTAATWAAATPAIVDATTSWQVTDTGTQVTSSAVAGDFYSATTSDSATAWTSAQDGVYGIVSAVGAGMTLTSTSVTPYFRVTYGAAAATKAITIVNAASGAAGTPAFSAAGQLAATCATACNLPLTTKSASWTVTNATAGNAYSYSVAWTLAAAADTTPLTATPTTVYADSTGTITVPVALASPIDGATATVTITGFTTNPAVQIINWKKSAATTISVDSNGAYVALKSTNVITATITDAFGAGVAGVVLQPALSTGSSNYSATAVIPTTTTGADGKATFSLTDAAAVAAGYDAVSFSAVAGTTLAGTASSTITYAATAPQATTLAAYTGTYSGTDSTLVTPVPAAGLDESLLVKTNRNNSLAITASGTNEYKFRVSTGVVGAKVTASGSAGVYFVGSTNFISAKASTKYSDTTGYTSNWKVGSTKTGTNTVTFTQGTVSTSITFTTTNAATDARTVKVSQASAGGPVTVSVVDRFGNGVSGENVQVGVSAGTLGNGQMTTVYSTDLDGNIKVLPTGDAAAVVTATLSTARDTASVAGYMGTTVIDSTVAAGIRTATATITPASTAGAQTAAEAATDAAAEATDAANAATDAANAAAEAADAATAAAQDAADAVAALSAQVSALISGLKAQLTALTNLVIKIQKKVKA